MFVFGERSSQESECQQSIKLYVNSVFVRPGRARARETDPLRSLLVQRLQFPPRRQFPPRALTCGLPACVRACARPPHRQSPQRCRKYRASTCLPRACVHCSMCYSVYSEIAAKSSSGVPKVSKRTPPLLVYQCCGSSPEY